MDKMTEINYKSLSEQERSELRKVYQNIDKIWEFQCKVNQKLMIYLFGESLGGHYWDNFVRKYNRNINDFMRGMDSNAKGDLVANIFLNDNLYAHCI